jgi:hypothetical protein
MWQALCLIIPGIGPPLCGCIHADAWIEWQAYSDTWPPPHLCSQWWLGTQNGVIPSPSPYYCTLVCFTFPYFILLYSLYWTLLHLKLHYVRDKKAVSQLETRRATWRISLCKMVTNISLFRRLSRFMFKNKFWMKNYRENPKTICNSSTIYVLSNRTTITLFSKAFVIIDLNLGLALKLIRKTWKIVFFEERV